MSWLAFRWERETVFKGRYRLIVIIYIIIGLIVAWDRGYLTVAFLKALLSAVLAILLWWLVLLGVSLHIH